MKKFFDKFGIMIPFLIFIVVTITNLIQHGLVNFVETTIKNIFFYLVTCQMIPSIILHSVKRESTASYIGWESSHFQNTLAGYSLSLSILGVMCTIYQGAFWIVTTIAVTLFLWPCAISHIVEIKKNGNVNAGNAGYILYWDIFMPLSLIVLLVIHFQLF